MAHAMPGPEAPLIFDVSRPPFPSSSSPSWTTIDLPIISQTLTLSSRNLKVALPLLLASMFPRSPTCL
uniref:Uncharacterized protein n=1 Tax=Ciona intestinalis TaxID=7719 RepID=H2XL68_CIOIN